MARKTNKTDHVLNLLAGQNGAEETADKNLESEVTEKPNGAEKPNGSNVRVVASQEEDDKIADAVKQLLEEELEAESTDDMPEAVDLPVFEEEDTAAELPVEEALAAEAVQKAEEIPADEETEMPEVVPEAEEEEADYTFLNVMEKLVREKVLTYMKQFGNCTCSRCVADTVALSLIHLPPKYVVVNKNAVAPLMNFYTKHYAGQITVEITKACIRVNQYPHHGRE